MTSVLPPASTASDESLLPPTAQHNAASAGGPRPDKAGGPPESASDRLAALEQMALEVEQIFRRLDPGAFFVMPRVLRRVLRNELEISSPWVRVPHRKSYVVDRDKLVWLVARDELGVDSSGDLPPRAILLARPETDQLARFDRERLLRYYWRLLFHARLDLILHESTSSARLSNGALRQRIERIGQTQFDEIRTVLQQELMLLNTADDRHVLAEFMAVYCEQRAFSPEFVPLYFPSLEDFAQLDADAEADCQPAHWLRATQPPGLEDAHEPAPVASSADSPIEPARAEVASPWVYRRRTREAAFYRGKGNHVRAALCRLRAARVAPLEHLVSAQAEAEQDIHSLAQRLVAALGQPAEQVSEWASVCRRLFERAEGGFYSAAARLLYDLQNICVDSERDIYEVDLLGCLVSLGREPLKVLLPYQRLVLMAKHLRRATGRLAGLRLPADVQLRLSGLLHQAAAEADRGLRVTLAPKIAQVLRDSGLGPTRAVELVAFDKIVDELLDGVVERGFITLGHLRDALSRGQLKLPDLDDLHEFLHGDSLLTADKQLARVLRGVYQRGPFYLRWLQRMNSVMFGTQFGRVITKYLLLPFGAAFLALKGLQHLVDEVLIFAWGPAPASSAQAGAAIPRTAHEGHAGPSDALGTQSATADHEPTDVVSAPGAPVSSDAETGAMPEPPSGPATDADATVTSPAAPSAASDVDADPVAPATAPPRSVAPDEAAPVPADGAGPTDWPVDEEAPHSGTDAVATTAVATTEAPSITGPHDPAGHTTSTAVVPPHAIPHEHGSWVHIYSESGVLLLGCILFALIHTPEVRRVAWQTVTVIGRAIHLLFWRIPHAVVTWPPMARLLRSLPAILFRRYILSPLAVTVILCELLPALGLYHRGGFWIALPTFFAVFFALNSRVGRDTEELAWEFLGRAWHQFRVNFVIALFSAAIEFFRQVMDVIERILYAVDEWLRFRSGETAISLAFKAVLGVIWGFVHALIRFCVTLLIEPQVNPIKHFPVVTVSHKLIFPFTGNVIYLLTPLMGKLWATTAGPAIIAGVPGVFGFLVWEFKENWKLYAANRNATLKPSLVGHHGETLLRLLRPGFHSGTIPKLFAKRRRTVRKSRWQPEKDRRTRFEEQLHQTAEAIHHFVERELLSLWKLSPELARLEISLGHVALATNRIELTLIAAGSDEPFELNIAEQSGWLIAGVTREGWTRGLTSYGRLHVVTGLAGLYKLGSVDLVREQIEFALGPQRHPYDIAEAGLVVWPGFDFENAVHYTLTERPNCVPRPRYLARSSGLEPLPANALIFGEQPLEWSRWSEYWDAVRQGELPSPILPPHVRLLPS